MTSSRMTEKWMNRGLWLIALIFAGFLIGLGGLIVEDLPKVDHQSTLREHLDQAAYDALTRHIEQQQAVIDKANTEVNEEMNRGNQLNVAYSKSKEAFNNWLSTRQATQDGKQNPEVISRTRELEKQLEQLHQQDEKVAAAQQRLRQLQDALNPEYEKRSQMEAEANKGLAKVQRAEEVRVFIYRLALTLPLLLIAGWLFARRRKGQYWPFVWGFIFFALFAFFVELVPYLPSYGGYVRYVVGILVTVAAGHYAIKALQRYLENQKKTEAMPKVDMKEKMSYELAQQRLGRGICPGCERPIDLKDPARNYCIHCGTCVYNHCVSCNTRKNAFAKHCHSCGTAA